MNLDFYRTASAFSDPGSKAALFDGLPHGHARVPRAQRGQFVGVGEARGRRCGIGGRR